MCLPTGDRAAEQANSADIGTGEKAESASTAESSDPNAAAQPTMSAEQVAANLGDDYEVLGLLGQGGMGVVYKVRDRKLNKVFAVKVLNPNLVEDSQSVKRFEQEAKAATALTHVNLAAVYDYGMGKQGAPYLVMDYLDGASLADLIVKEGFLDQGRAVDIFTQIAEALVSAHAKGVIHRDVKPSNIVVCQHEGTEIVKLVDFGIAKVLPSEARSAQMTQTGEIFGSPLYMSPEQCLGNKVDFRSDIYAFGCVMYEALTGVAPFAAENPIKTIMKHLNDAPLPIEKLPHDFGISSNLERILMHCLEKDASHRYQTAADLLRDLEAIRDGKPISVKAIRKPVAKEDGSAGAGWNARKHLSPRGRIWFILGCCCLLTIPLVATFCGTSLPGPISAGSNDPYTEADQYDARAAALCAQGQYDKAIDLLMFNLHTYKLDGNSKHESYLADCTQHVGQCYLLKKDYAAAQPYYRDALKIYSKWGGYPGGGMWEAVNDYAKVLQGLGQGDAAKAMLADWAAHRNARGYPALTRIP